MKKRLDRRTSARRGMQADEGSVGVAKDAPRGSHKPDFTPETKPSIERHTFKEPTRERYNPYA
jgi:hypothetical protein